MHTGYHSSPTVELTWALILATARNIVVEARSVRSGGWQRTVGDGLRGKVLGILGLGNIGSEVARVARAFGMEVIAWSENLTSVGFQTRSIPAGRYSDDPSGLQRPHERDRGQGGAQPDETFSAPREYIKGADCRRIRACRRVARAPYCRRSCRRL